MVAAVTNVFLGSCYCLTHDLCAFRFNIAVRIGGGGGTDGGKSNSLKQRPHITVNRSKQVLRATGVWQGMGYVMWKEGWCLGGGGGGGGGVNNNGLALRYASDELKSDREFVLAA
jgi:hypothetical protein